MNQEALAEAKETLGVEGEEDELKKLMKEEARFEARQTKILKTAGFLSALTGLGIGNFYAYMDRRVAYPGHYSPPGGPFLPLAVFISATLTGTAYGKYRIEKKGFPGMKQQLQWLFMAVPLFILVYVLSYSFGFGVGAFTHTIMYGVYSRDEKEGTL